MYQAGSKFIELAKMTKTLKDVKTSAIDIMNVQDDIMDEDSGI